MKFSLLILGIAIAIPWGSVCLAQEADAEAAALPTDVVSPESADEGAIRANCQKYVDAFNRRDSQAMSSFWSPDAVYTDPSTGEGVSGRDAIAKQFDYIFAGAEDAKLEVTIDSIEFLSPNVAVEKGTTLVTYSEYEPEESQYSAIHVKRDGEWLIDRLTESDIPAPPPSNYEYLKELEWLVGRWINDDEALSVEMQCGWTKNRNFLTRSFAVVTDNSVELSGMQIIGWDPAAEQIRSWVFDSSGGFGEGVWSRSDEKWTIQSTGVIADGRKSATTSILTFIDENSYSWQTVNREVDGEILPNVPEVVLMRDTEE